MAGELPRTEPTCSGRSNTDWTAAGRRGWPAYGGAKAALNVLANVVHLELADSGIRTVAIAPGLTYSPGMRAIVGEDHLNRVAANYPGGRIGEPEDIVALTNFLCSDAANHLSGTVITVRPPVTR